MNPEAIVQPGPLRLVCRTWRCELGTGCIAALRLIVGRRTFLNPDRMRQSRGPKPIRRHSEGSGTTTRLAVLLFTSNSLLKGNCLCENAHFALVIELTTLPKRRIVASNRGINCSGCPQSACNPDFLSGAYWESALERP